MSVLEKVSATNTHVVVFTDTKKPPKAHWARKLTDGTLVLNGSHGGVRGVFHEVVGKPHTRWECSPIPNAKTKTSVAAFTAKKHGRMGVTLKDVARYFSQNRSEFSAWEPYAEGAPTQTETVVTQNKVEVSLPAPAPDVCASSVELVADGHTDFGGVSLRSAQNGKWISVLDIGVKLDGKRSLHVLRDYSIGMDTISGIHLKTGTYRDARNIPHPDTFVRIDHLEQFVAEKVRNRAISQPIRERIATLSRRFTVGDQRLHDAIDANAEIADEALATAPDSGLAAMARLNDAMTPEEDARADALLSPDTTATIMGAGDVYERVKAIRMSASDLMDAARGSQNCGDALTKRWLYVVKFKGVVDMTVHEGLATRRFPRERVLLTPKDALHGVVKAGITKNSVPVSNRRSPDAYAAWRGAHPDRCVSRRDWFRSRCRGRIACVFVL